MGGRVEGWRGGGGMEWQRGEGWVEGEVEGGMEGWGDLIK